MKAKLIHSRKALLLLLGAALILLLVIGLSSTNGLARYRSQVVFSNEIKYNNSLAASFTLLNEGGEAEIQLVPGTTVSFDPELTITGKTAIPAYLYIEVTNDSDFYPVDENTWKKLDGVIGVNGGDVYTYAQGALTGSGEADETIGVKIFAEPAVELSKKPQSGGGTIRLYGYLIQQLDDSGAEDCFTQAISLPNP